MVKDSKRPPPSIGHGKVKICLIPFAGMLCGNVPFMATHVTIFGYTAYYKWIYYYKPYLMGGL